MGESPKTHTSNNGTKHTDSNVPVGCSGQYDKQERQYGISQASKQATQWTTSLEASGRAPAVPPCRLPRPLSRSVPHVPHRYHTKQPGAVRRHLDIFFSVSILGLSKWYARTHLAKGHIVDMYCPCDRGPMRGVAACLGSGSSFFFSPPPPPLPLPLPPSYLYSK